MESLRSSTWGPFGGTNCARAETIRHGPPRGRHYQSCLWLPRACRPAVLLAGVGPGLHAQSAGRITMSGLPQGGIAVIDPQQNVYIAGGGGCAGDVVLKPFSFHELRARLRAMGRERLQDN